MNINGYNQKSEKIIENISVILTSLTVFLLSNFITAFYFTVNATEQITFITGVSYQYDAMGNRIEQSNYNPDSDIDGLLDSWELEYFGDLARESSQDSDNDGLTELEEYQANTNPMLFDTDEDGVGDGFELNNGMNPIDGMDALIDSDNDGLSDAFETFYELNINNAADAIIDQDNDGFPIWLEYHIQTSDNDASTKPKGVYIDFEDSYLVPFQNINFIAEPNQSLISGLAHLWYLDDTFSYQGTYSLRATDQSYGTGIEITIETNGEPIIFRYSTKDDYSHLANISSNLLFYIDGVRQTINYPENNFDLEKYKVSAGIHTFKWLIDPTEPEAWIDNLYLPINIGSDQDSDNIEDSWEYVYFGHLNQDMSQDSDNDGLLNFEEYQYKTDPNKQDSDFDGIADGFEINNGMDPLDANDILLDSDNDGLPDVFENYHELNYLDAADAKIDNDNDGYSAFVEFIQNTSDNDALDKPSGTLLDFENNDLNFFSWIKRDIGQWVTDSSRAYNGNYSLRSGDITSNDFSYLETIINATGEPIRFQVHLSIEGVDKYSGLDFYIDGVWQAYFEGELGFILVELPLSSGKHHLMWEFYQYGEGSYAWIDNLYIPALLDSDTDNIEDGWEYHHFDNLDHDMSQDTDNDGLTDSEEYYAETNPTSIDTDSDGVIDSEDAFPLDPFETKDSDWDGIGDNVDPINNRDTDDDYIIDTCEIAYFGDLTHDMSLDSDGDGLSDYVELSLNTNPTLVDTDGDGIDDAFEYNNNMNPLDASDAVLDTDGDGYTALEEYIAGSSDNDFDSTPLNLSGNVYIIDSGSIAEDTEAPVFESIPTLTIEATGVTTNVQLTTPDVTDNSLNSFGILTVTSDYGGPLLLGSHEITWTATDAAGNIATAIQIFNVVDTSPPVFAEPLIQNIDARGLSTSVRGNIAIVANDLVDGEILAKIEAESSYQSGQYTILATAQDSAGNSTSSESILNVHPLVQLEENMLVEAGGNYQVSVMLSGEAASYPVSLNYQLFGIIATSSANTLVFEQGVEQFIDITISPTASAFEMATLTLVAPTNAVISNNNELVFTVIEDNQSPIVKLSVEQSGRLVSVLEPQAGVVTVTAVIYDLNQADEHLVAWDAGEFSATDFNINEQPISFEFDPSILVTGSYLLSIEVTEINTQDLFSTSTDILLHLASELQELSEIDDADGDGIPDAEEGYGDADQDGIADYLDDDSNTSRLPIAEGVDPMQTVTGLSLSLGDLARSPIGSLSTNSSIDFDNIASNDGTSNQNTKDPHYEIFSAIINFNVSGLATVGDSVPVIIPLADTKLIPENAVYRKYHPTTGWFNFVIDEKNQILSAKKDNDANCPQPLTTDYVKGLTEGDSCIELIIEDGGPNDIDGQANGIVKDPSVLAIELSNQAPVISIQTILSVNENSDVELDASMSTDAEGNILNFSWTQLTGITVEITDVNSPILSFMSPALSSAEPSKEILTFELMVDDGRDSAKTIIEVFVLNINYTPIASVQFVTDNLAGTSINEGETIELISTSTDPDDDILTYLWEQVSGPIVTFSDAANISLFFPAPMVSSDQSVELKLTVSDDTSSDVAFVSFEIKNVEKPITPQVKKNQGGSMDWLLNIFLFFMCIYCIASRKNHKFSIGFHPDPRKKYKSSQ